MELTTHPGRFALFALATALGVSSIALVHCGDSSSSSAGDASAGDGQNSACPILPPTVGGPCSIEATQCTYPGPACECCAGSAPYVCTGGKWTELPSGGPPGVGVCPPEVPTQGTPCGPSCGAQLSCTYDCAHGNGANSSATCASGTWQVRQFASPCSSGFEAGIDASDAGDASDAPADG